MLGIVIALPVERSWLGRIEVPRGPMVEVSGIGGPRARVAAQRLLSSGATALASWGSAAGIERGLDAGTVVLPEMVLTTDGQAWPVDGDWLRRLSARLGDQVPMHRGALVHAPRLLATVADKARLYRSTGAVAADMESGAVAAVAADATVPFLAVRVVLDAASSALPRMVSSGLDVAGRIRPSAVWEVLGHPREWRPVVDLVRSFRAARRTMVELWRLAAPDLALASEASSMTDGADSDRL